MRFSKEQVAAKLKKAWQAGGFYLVVALCITMVGGGAYFARNRAARVPPTAPLPAPSPAQVASSLDERLAQVQKETLLNWPVSGRTVLCGHSPDQPIWSDTLNMYRAHVGLDIEAARGEAVRASLAGRVTAAYQDALLGYTIEVTNEQGVMARYANLSTLRQVEVGQRVAQGDVIGAVGESAASEGALGAHLHFEAYENGAWLELPEA